jgi:hypothetical protein
MQDKHTIEQDTSLFLDSAHHWYDIQDEDKMIVPIENQKKYSLSEIEKIADIYFHIKNQTADGLIFIRMIMAIGSISHLMMSL